MMTPITLGTAAEALTINLAEVHWIRFRPDHATVHFHRAFDLVITDPSEVSALRTRVQNLETPPPTAP